MPNLVHYTCTYCGAHFNDYACMKRRFCSHACYSLSKRKPKERTCEQCGNSFTTVQAEIDKARSRGGDVRYCSRECWKAATRNRGALAKAANAFRYTCKQCGKRYSRPREWGKAGGKFCSGACRKSYLRSDGAVNSNWRGGITPLHEMERKSWQYKDWRKAVFERDNYTCRKCSKCGSRLHAHHLYKFSDYPHLRYNVSNGHTLCRACHLAIKNREADYLHSIGLDPAKPPLF